MCVPGTLKDSVGRSGIPRGVLLKCSGLNSSNSIFGRKRYYVITVFILIVDLISVLIFWRSNEYGFRVGLSRTFARTPKIEVSTQVELSAGC